MSWTTPVGYGAVGVIVVGWLAVSFMTPGRGRGILEAVSTSAMFVALGSLFVHLLARALEMDNTVAVVAFGFLATLFGTGLLVSLYQLMAELRGPTRGHVSATN